MAIGCCQCHEIVRLRRVQAREGTSDNQRISLCSSFGDTERSAFSMTMQDNELPGYIAVGYSVQSDDSIGLVA
jgi:hypothetical protein